MRAKTYGVKKPRDEKIRKYYGQKEGGQQEKRRYYPLNHEGNVDEWRAMEQLKQNAIQQRERQQKAQGQVAKQTYQ